MSSGKELRFADTTKFVVIPDDGEPFSQEQIREIPTIFEGRNTRRAPLRGRARKIGRFNPIARGPKTEIPGDVKTLLRNILRWKSTIRDARLKPSVQNFLEIQSQLDKIEVELDGFEAFSELAFAPSAFGTFSRESSPVLDDEETIPSFDSAVVEKEESDEDEEECSPDIYSTRRIYPIVARGTPTPHESVPATKNTESEDIPPAEHTAKEICPSCLEEREFKVKCEAERFSEDCACSACIRYAPGAKRQGREIFVFCDRCRDLLTNQNAVCEFCKERVNVTSQNKVYAIIRKNSVCIICSSCKDNRLLELLYQWPVCHSCKWMNPVIVHQQTWLKGWLCSVCYAWSE
jgi:hypothetical protein